MKNSSRQKDPSKNAAFSFFTLRRIFFQCLHWIGVTHLSLLQSFYFKVHHLLKYRIFRNNMKIMDKPISIRFINCKGMLAEKYKMQKYYTSRQKFVVYNA